MSARQKQAGFLGAGIVALAAVLLFYIGSAPALQTLSDQEMEAVAGREAIWIGVGQGFPFHGGASNIQLEFYDSDGTNWMMEFIERPDSAGDTPLPAGYPSYGYDRYSDEVALKICNVGTTTLGPAQVLVPLKIKMDIETTGVNTKPLLDIELYTEYTSWPSDPEPDFYFDQTILRQNAGTAWYNDSTWQEGFELHVDGITFLSYPYHDVDDADITPELNPGYPPVANRTPAMHITLGSDNTEQGLVGELGMKLHLPGIIFRSITTNSAYTREFGLEGVLAAGKISQPWSYEFSYNVRYMDFDGEFTIGMADSDGTPTPRQDNYTDQNRDADSSNYWPLTISPAAYDIGNGTTGAFVVIEACGTKTRSVDYPISDLAGTLGGHPYYSGTQGGNIYNEVHEYIMGDLRVGHVYSILDYDDDGNTDLENQSLGTQAAVISDINVPYARVVMCVDQRLDDILDAAYNTNTLELIDNTCMHRNTHVIRFGRTSDGNQDDCVTARPTTIHWGNSGTWYTPSTNGTGNVWR